MDHYIAGDDERARCRGILHIVQNGDTLYKIAKQYGVPLSRVMYANPYVDVYNLQIGDEICVPVASRPPHPGNRPGMRPPMQGNRPGCICPPTSGNRPGMRPPASGNRPGMRPPMQGNRPGCICPPTSGNRPGMRPPTSGNRLDLIPSESGEGPEVPPSEPEDRSDISPRDEMTSRQPWDRDGRSEQENRSPMSSGQQGNSFPSVSIRREDDSYPSMRHGMPSNMRNDMNGNIQNDMRNDMSDNMRNDMSDNMRNDMSGNMRNDTNRNMPNNMRNGMEGNMPNRTQDHAWDDIRGGMQDDRMDYGQSSFADPWMVDRSADHGDDTNCKDFGCSSAHEQMENSMPWHNTTNSKRMMDEYLMGMPRMENEK